MNSEQTGVEIGGFTPNNSGMALPGIEVKMGVTTDTLVNLLDGKATVGIAGKLGLTISSVQKFLDGVEFAGISSRIGCSPAALEDLRRKVGKDGAIGIVIALCLKS